MTILDGATGTALQALGLKSGDVPEDWNVERPEDVASVHRAYAEAGAEVVYANTFGANRLKYRGRHALEEVIAAGVALARRSGARVALDIGPTGRLLKPAGDLGFDAAYEAFAEAVRIGAAAGADLIAVETMSDLLELKAAVLAARENASLPVFATVALGADGKLLTGASVEGVAALLEALGVDAHGLNCGLGPEAMLPYVERLARVSTRPIIVKPNAGLPRVVDGRTVFGVAPEAFAGHVARLVAAGARIVGGCCGTTPAHIRSIEGCLEVWRRRPRRRDASAIRAPCQPPNVATPRAASPHCTSPTFGNSELREFDQSPTVIASGADVVTLRPGQGLVIGERINPTGRKLLKAAFARGDVAYVLREAVSQVEAGAAVLDVNCGVPGLDEAATLDATVQAVQSVAACPIQIDTANPAALERALRHVNGKALVNSVNGSRESMDAVFPLVRRYGGVIVALCLDEGGIPETVEGRLAVARKILAEGANYGFSERDFVFDALTLAVSVRPDAARVTLETVRRLTEDLRVNTVLGVSNVSFGLPNRAALNDAMYALARRAGLSAAIANPSALTGREDPAAVDVLLGRDPNCARWIAAQAAASAAPAAPQAVTAPDALAAAIRRGLRDDARQAAADALAAGRDPMDLVRGGIVPALEIVGAGFEAGRVYLPQLLMAADAAGEAFAVLRAKLARGAAATDAGRGERPIVLATVRGDVHDIGKNIVRALLENYGFDVIDLGRDVAPERIVETAAASGAFLVGLSALMTTTVGAMAETIRQLKAANLACRTVVGGAVVTQDFADSIGADHYARDAMQTVRLAERLLREVQSAK